VKGLKAGIDPIKFEVIRSALGEIAEEMAAALRRSAYSTNIKTRADFSCAIFDQKLRPVAQSWNQPNHLGSLAHLVPQVVHEYGRERLNSGDGLLSNSPFLGGVHLNDIALISPVFHGDNIAGFVANIAHHVDVGGGAPASIGAFQEVYQEGVIIPPVKLINRGTIIPDVLKLILGQVRAKRETAGDLRAQVAANNTGIRRFCALLDRLGAATVANYIDELIAYTEGRTRAEVAKLPRGTFTADGYLDNDGFTDQAVHLVAKVVIDDEGVVFDLTDSDPQRRAPVNSTYAQSYSGCAFVLKALIDPDIPVNAGFYSQVRMIAPIGTVVNCAPPGPVVGGWETQQRVTDVILKALSKAIPDRIPAGTKAMICHSGFGGRDPRTGEYYCFLETMAGGFGGRATSDGPDAVQTHGQNTENAPIEETEYNYPVYITRYELVNDSDGPGKHRGGLGLRRDYLFTDHEVSFTILADRDRWGPWGLFGGLPGRKASYILNPDGEAFELSSKKTVQLKPGDVVSYRTCGGGGYGPPKEREPSAVLNDVRNGKVSLDRAREIYRVAIHPEAWVLDGKETENLRREREGKSASE
jgi:N-methylhydantoinase B